ncbi:MAG TPA: molybdopterin-dependent oxidoreductase [Thermomicrobiales bacterium]|nr:molybdopterin-dependent oxidoreductase [Thermomicrobiales bacterium]
MAATTNVILTTCPRDCYDACGVAVRVRDGKIAQVRGDPNHPMSRGALCVKCSTGYNNEWLDPDVRLTHPLRRVGPKGAGHFAPVSWNKALAAIADRLREIVADSGAHTVVNAHYSGTLSLLGYFFPLRFFHRLGATEVVPDSICNLAGHVALPYVYGTSFEGFDPRTVRDAACLLVWGANPASSAPHAFEHWFCTAPGTKIVVDPIHTETAKASDLHLQPFPGSDAALAFALLHVLRRDGLVDRAFVARYTIGWEELDPLLDDCTPAWGEATTGVPAELIERTAHHYGSGPSLLWLGQGLQRQPTGGNVMRACALLPAATGNLGKPGAGFLYLNWFNARGIDEAYLTAAHLSRGVPPISHMDLADCLADPTRSQAFFCWNMNVAASGPRQQQLRQALRRDDLFTIVIDLFQTDTADFADVVLPAASFLEFDDLFVPYFQLLLSAQVKAMEPLGEALPNPEIFRRLARAMDYTEQELYEPDAEVINTVVRASSLVEDFATLAARGSVPVSAEPRIQFADLSFATASGRIEIASAQAEADGHPRVPQPLADPRPTNGQLRLLSPASTFTLNDSFANVTKLAKRAGAATVTLHPADAAARGLAEGEEALLSNETGSLKLLVRLSNDVPPGVALSHKGRWPKQEPQEANVNVLNPGRKTDMGENSCVHSVEITVSRVS